MKNENEELENSTEYIKNLESRTDLADKKKSRMDRYESENNEDLKLSVADLKKLMGEIKEEVKKDNKNVDKVNMDELNKDFKDLNDTIADIKLELKKQKERSLSNDQEDNSIIEKDEKGYDNMDQEFDKIVNKNKKKIGLIRIISRILSMAALGVLIVFFYLLSKANVLPNKYLFIIIGFFSLLEFMYLFFSFNKRTRKKTLIFFDVIAVLMMIIQIFGIVKINETLDFLNKNLSLKYDTNTYYVVVNKQSSYNKLSDINNKTLYGFKDLDDIKPLEREVKKVVNVKLEYEKDVVKLMDSIIDNKEKVILLNSGNYDAKTDIEPDYSKETKILGEIKLKTRTKTNKTNIDVTEDPFTIYLSGIDTRSGGMPTNSLSDVNMVIAVNPNTKKVLLTSIPRDYYVQLHGTSGLNDKLTHAGALGGVKLSKATIEDLLDKKIDFYARVNFNSVVRLVDAVGGITLYSDVDYPFTCWTDNGCRFTPGNNDVKGRCALAFARERYAYDSGDRHRGENQQQVIKQVLNKVTSSSTLIKNYSTILNSLNGTFESSLSTEDITSLVKYQINDMSKWTIVNANLDGTTGMTYTYSSPGRKLSVMYPNEKTVETAKKQINDVLNEK